MKRLKQHFDRALNSKSIALPTLASIAGVLTVTLASFVVPQRPAIAQRTGMTASADIEDLAENPGKYVGRTVSLTGEIEETRSPYIFELEEDGGVVELFNDDSVLVVSNDISQAPIEEGREVRITGQVREFSIVEIERDYDFDFDDLAIREELEYEYEGRPVVYADSIQILPE
ncbi:hypothetical protein [Baaleninema simplex]|uniref:hypothetical protein n=1 Tax=Baaleninema simplex TaxID=2862350 RepID=UPI00034BCBB4|nr:hypothetical protein [Baaleninema simplex]